MRTTPGTTRPAAGGRRGVLARLALLALLAPAAAFAADGPHAVVEAGPIVLFEEPIRVVARFADESPGLYLCSIDVSRGNRSYELRTVIRPEAPGGFDRALETLRRSMGWKDRYFFVGTSCGPGNAWKCSSEAVFTLVKGELVGLGSLAARAPEGFGTCFNDGVFLDLDTEFEGNDLTSHANAPRIDIVLRERGGRFVGDTAATWARNARQFALNDSLAKSRTEPETVGYRRTWEFALSPRIENAMLAKYCGRTAVYDSILAEARRVLPAETIGPFLEMMSRVEPGALPRRSRLMPSGAR